MSGYPITVCNHSFRLRFLVPEVECSDVTCVRIVVVWKVNDGHRFGIITSKERCPLVETLGDKGVDRGNEGHAGQIRGLGLLESGIDFGTVGKVVRGVS